MIVGLVSLCLGAAVCYSLTRPEGYFTSIEMAATNVVKGGSAAKPAKDDGPGKPAKDDGFGKPVDDPSQPANVNQAVQMLYLGNSDERAGSYKAAVEHYKQACKLDPIRKFYWAALGSTYMLLSQYDDAQAAYWEVYNRDVYDSFNLGRLGYVSEALRRDDQARRFYLMVLSIEPDNQDAWLELNNIARGLDIEGFLEQIHRASLIPTDSANGALVYQINQASLDHNPNDYYYLVNRALMNIRALHLANVQQDIDKALKIQKNGSAALLAQAQLYSNMGNLDKAVEAYKLCLAVSPQPMAYAELGALEIQQGHIDQAFHDYGKATELGNDKPSWVATFEKLKKEKIKHDQEALAKNNKTGAKAIVPSTSDAK